MKIIKSEKTVIFCQQSPMRRTICIGRTNFFISLPSVIFKILYKKNYGLFEQTYLMIAFTDNNKIYYPALPNISACLSVCSPLVPSNMNLENLAKEIISNFWMSEFNYTYSGSLGVLEIFRNRNAKKIKRYFFDWQEKTKNDLNWIPNNFVELSKFNFDYFFDEDYIIKEFLHE